MYYAPTLAVIRAIAGAAPTKANQTASVPDRLTNMMQSRRFSLYAIGK